MNINEHLHAQDNMARSLIVTAVVLMIAGVIFIKFYRWLGLATFCFGMASYIFSAFFMDFISQFSRKPN